MSNEYAVMPFDDYVSACDTIKEKTGAESNHIKSGELPTKIDEVYEKGEEAGKQTYYNWFWDTAQQGGTVPLNYSGAFQARIWSDVTYNPKYKIYPTACNTLFGYNTTISDTKVEIDLTYQNMTQYYNLFSGCTKLETIRLLRVLPNKKFTGDFDNCRALKNITFEGEIGQSISFASSPLTVESMKSVINHLVKYAGTANDGEYTLTFTNACWTNLAEYDYESPNGVSWKTYVTDSLGWLA